MRRLLLATTCLLTLAAAPALAQTGGTAGSGSLTPLDRNFAAEAAMSGLAEVRLGQLAQRQATDAEVKQFAERMVQDHTRTNEQLQAIAASKGITLPQSLDPASQAQLDALQLQNGPAFDYRYMDGQEAMHETAVRLFEMQANNGQDNDLKPFARQALPALREHGQAARELAARIAQRNPQLTQSGKPPQAGSTAPAAPGSGR